MGLRRRHVFKKRKRGRTSRRSRRRRRTRHARGGGFLSRKKKRGPSSEEINRAEHAKRLAVELMRKDAEDQTRRWQETRTAKWGFNHYRAAEPVLKSVRDTRRISYRPKKLSWHGIAYPPPIDAEPTILYSE